MAKGTGGSRAAATPEGDQPVVPTVPVNLIEGVLLTSAPGVAVVINVNVSVVPNKTPNAAAVALWVRRFREAMSEDEE